MEHGSGPGRDVILLVKVIIRFESGFGTGTGYQTEVDRGCSLMGDWEFKVRTIQSSKLISCIL
jgi:hypothetical protein